MVSQGVGGEWSGAESWRRRRCSVHPTLFRSTDNGLKMAGRVHTAERLVLGLVTADLSDGHCALLAAIDVPFGLETGVCRESARPTRRFRGEGDMFLLRIKRV